ncbi:protein ENL-like [Amphibalanus amphitrite]|uniref:protein ENL-like n=1 Tax=Amphibalanus amphitrite TaxID=1232801 RepID=UPI001C90A777|nr:protein ENL-like [Amphibalanus amphitrite]
MPLLPQLLEPLSPMSPLSVSPPLSPELPLSPLSPLSSPRSPPSARREKMPEGDFYLGPPEPITTCNPRSSHHRTRLTTDRLSDSDSDSDSDSADGQTTRWARARRRGTHRDRLDSASTASGDSSAAPRAERQRRGAARPARAAVGSCPSGAAWPAERRPSDAATPADRFDRQRSSGGRCAECSAGGCSQQPPARPPAADSRHSAPDRHPNTSGPRSPQTQPRPGRPDRPGSGRGTDEPPADLATTCGRPEPTDAANADGRRGSPDGRPGSPNGRAGSPGEPAPRDLTIFTSEYLSELLQLQRRIMTSRDSEEMTRVLELLWGTGQVQDSALYYDFDLCALDQGVVRQLQKCLS